MKNRVSSVSLLLLFITTLMAATAAIGAELALDANPSVVSSGQKVKISLTVANPESTPLFDVQLRLL